MSGSSAVRSVLERVARGELAVDEAEAALASSGVEEMGFAALDLARQARRGRPETIFGEGKAPGQIVAIAERLAAAGQGVLATRLAPEACAALAEAFAGRGAEFNDAARTFVLRAPGASRPQRRGTIGVVAAGTTDLPVAEEAAVAADFFGSPVLRAYDVGVAGIHRLFRRIDELAACRALVVVAGMEGALPSVIAGLVRGPVFAVPTSIGYGANFGGLAALLTMVNSCAPGVAVLNIDNGFGAGYLADVVNEIGDGGDAA